MTPRDLGWGAPGVGSGLVRIDIPGIPLNVRRETAAVFTEMVRWLTQERRKSGAPPLTSSGGYVKRPVRGYEARYARTRDEALLSNHSWGTAIDLNAATNPMGGPLRTDMPPGTLEKARSLGLAWGATWGRPDPMHFEVAVSPQRLAEISATLRAYELGQRVLREGMRGPRDVAALQTLVNASGLASTAVDDDFGPRTTEAVTACQRALSLKADGIAGPVTLAALEDAVPLSDDDVDRIADRVWQRARASSDGEREVENVPAVVLWAALRGVDELRGKVDRLLDRQA